MCIVPLGLAGCATPAIDQVATQAIASNEAATQNGRPIPIRLTRSQEETIIAQALLAHEMRRP